jgi:hypothetical protein
MAPTDDQRMTDVARRAEAMAARMDEAESFTEARRSAGPEYDDLLRAIRELDARFAFDRDGRPGAVGAVREALPLMERELFDAVLDDHACEVAAIEEALYQLLCAYSRRSTS